MKRLFLISVAIICTIFFSFCVSKEREQVINLNISHLKKIYIRKNDLGKIIETDTNHLIGLFPIKKDTVAIINLDSNLTEEISKTSYWWNKDIKNQKIIFYNSEEDSVCVYFDDNRKKIQINNDFYNLSKKDYIKFKQSVLTENSILDLVSLVNEGYGDYKPFFELLNENWDVKIKNNKYKITNAQIKNRDYQTNNMFFEFEVNYYYDDKGNLLKAVGGEMYNRELIEIKNNKIVYSIYKSANQRASINEVAYTNLKTSLDSVNGVYEPFSNENKYDYTVYQSLRETITTKEQNLSDSEIINLFKNNK